MARIRTIKPDFWEDEKVGTLSHGARLLFLGSLNLADDEGLLRWNPLILGATVFAYDDIKPETVMKWMAEVEDAKIIFKYRAGVTNQPLGWIINFLRHQRIDKPQPSKLIPPTLQDPDVRQAYFRRDRGLCQYCNEPIDLSDDLNSGSRALSIEHIVQRAKGGSDYPSNIRIVHVACNKSSSDRDLWLSVNGSEIDSRNDSENGSESNSKIVSESDSTLERKGKGRGMERKCKESPLTPPGGIAGRFTEFWEAYPRRVGKGAAERIFLRLKVDEALLETMLNAIERAKHSKAWNKNGGEFIPHPSTWLNQKRWLDEVPQTHLVIGKHPDSLPEPPSLRDEERSLMNGITKYERLREERGLEELEEKILSNLQRDLAKLRAEKEKAS